MTQFQKKEQRHQPTLGWLVRCSMYVGPWFFLFLGYLSVLKFKCEVQYPPVVQTPIAVRAAHIPFRGSQHQKKSSPEAKTTLYQPASLSYDVLKVSESQNSFEATEKKLTKRVLVAVGTSLMRQEPESSYRSQAATVLNSQLRRLENTDLSNTDILTIADSYSFQVKNLLSTFHKTLQNSNPEFVKYLLTKPETYQARSEVLSGLAGVREDGTSRDFTRRQLQNLLTSTETRQFFTAACFSDLFENLSASDIAGELQQTLTSCQNTYSLLRKNQVFVETFTAVRVELEGLANVLNAPPRVNPSRGIPGEVKLYWKPVDGVDVHLAGSLNFRSRDFSLGVGHARFHKIPKISAGFIYGADVGPTFRRTPDRLPSYDWKAIEGRVFVGVGFEL